MTDLGSCPPSIVGGRGIERDQEPAARRDNQEEVDITYQKVEAHSDGNVLNSGASQPS